MNPLLTLALAVTTLVATDPQPRWRAHWIWDADATTPNRWVDVRGAFELATVPRRASARIAVDSRYALWVNGRLVVREGGLGRGPTPSGGYHDIVDLAPFLVKGRNVVAARAWYWGKRGRYHRSSGAGGFVLELSSSDEVLAATDGRWRVRADPSFGRAAPPDPPSFLPPHNVHVDARRADDWTSPAYDDRGWSPAVDRGAPPAAPWGELEPRPIPPWREGVLRSYDRVDDTPLADGGHELRARLPHMMQVHPVLRVRAPAGLTIDVRTDRYEVQGGPGDEQRYPTLRAEYVTREGVQEFELPLWLAGEAVIYRVPAGVEILHLQFRETGYDADPAGAFASSDPRLDRLWDKARRTLAVNLRDTYMDCPDRERGPWIADASVEIAESFYALDRNVDALTRKTIRELVRWQKPDGRLLTLAGGGDAFELPSQSLLAISPRGPAWTLYDETGDATLLAESYAAATRYLGLWTLGPDGTVLPRKGDWAWFDHGDGVDARVLENAWYAWAIDAQARAADVLARADEARGWRERRERLAAAFRAAFDHADGYRSGAEPDERANAIAVLAGLAAPERSASIAALLECVRRASPFMEGFVLEALFRLGRPAAALARMRARFGPMIDDAGSTLWESFDHHGSANHGWSGLPLVLLAREVVGVAPAEAGWKRVRIAPALGDLTRARAIVATIAGEVTVAVVRRRAHVVVDAKVPAPATVELPATDDRGRALTLVTIGARPAKPSIVGARARVDAPEGSWQLDARYGP